MKNAYDALLNKMQSLKDWWIYVVNYPLYIPWSGTLTGASLKSTAFFIRMCLSNSALLFNLLLIHAVSHLISLIVVWFSDTLTAWNSSKGYAPDQETLLPPLTL